MDSEDAYPTAKRRRTSSHDSTSSRASSTGREQGNDDHQRDRSLALRHAPPYSRSRSRSRRRRSTTESSAYTPPAYSRYESRSVSPIPAQKDRSLNFVPLATLPRAHARGITSLKFSPDYNLLATASADATINIYSVPADLSSPSTSFKLLRTLRAHLAGVNALAWSPIGPPYTLASASDDKSILLWSPLSSDFPISPSPLIGHHNYVYSLAFSPKGNMLVSGSYDEAVFLWDVRAAHVMRSLPAHSDPVRGVDFLRDGTMMCSCAGDGLIRIWDAGTGQCLKTLVDEDRKPVTSVRFTPNGKYLVAWTLDNCIRLWRYTEGKCVKTYQGHVNKEFSVGGVIGGYTRGHSQEAFLVSGSEDGDVVVWDVTTKEVLWRQHAHEDVVLGVEYGKAKDGRGLLVSGGKDRDVKVWIEDIDPAALKEATALRRQHQQQQQQDNDGVGAYMEVDTPDIESENIAAAAATSGVIEEEGNVEREEDSTLNHNHGESSTHDVNE